MQKKSQFSRHGTDKKTTDNLHGMQWEENEHWNGLDNDASYTKQNVHDRISRREHVVKQSSQKIVHDIQDEQAAK
jgi:hypothetical protein